MFQLSQNVPTISKRPNYLMTSQLTISKRPSYLKMSQLMISKCPNFLMWKIAKSYKIHAITRKLRKMLKVVGSIAAKKCSRSPNFNRSGGVFEGYFKRLRGVLGEYFAFKELKNLGLYIFQTSRS